MSAILDRIHDRILDHTPQKKFELAGGRGENLHTKMNRARPAHPKIAALLNTPSYISKRNLSGYLWFHINENGLLQNDGCHKYIKLDATLAELLKAPLSSKIVLFEHNKKIVDWWDVVDRVLKNW